MIGAQPVFTYKVLYTYSLCHICNFLSTGTSCSIILHLTHSLAFGIYLVPIEFGLDWFMLIKDIN